MSFLQKGLGQRAHAQQPRHLLLRVRGEDAVPVAGGTVADLVPVNGDDLADAEDVLRAALLQLPQRVKILLPEHKAHRGDAAGPHRAQVGRAAAGDASVTAELERRAAAYRRMGRAFADLLALHSDFSLAESLKRIDSVERIQNPEFEKVFFQNTGGSWYCRSHQYEFATHPYLVQMDELSGTLVSRAKAGDFSPLPKKLPRDPFAEMSEEDHPITSRRPLSARTEDNWRKTCAELATLSTEVLACRE